MPRTVRLSFGALAFLLGLAVVAPAGAHGDDHAGRSAKPSHQAAEQYVFGLAGDPAKVSRTIAVEMSDAMRFSPSLVQVERGETVRFVLKNPGRVQHELVIGTQASLEEHARQMKKSPGMEHDEPHGVRVAPGTTGAIVWQFNRAGEFRFGCLVAGHLEAGVAGRVIVL